MLSSWGPWHGLSVCVREHEDDANQPEDNSWCSLWAWDRPRVLQSHILHPKGQSGVQEPGTRRPSLPGRSQRTPSPRTLNLPPKHPKSHFAKDSVKEAEETEIGKAELRFRGQWTDQRGRSKLAVFSRSWVGEDQDQRQTTGGVPFPLHTWAVWCIQACESPGVAGGSPGLSWGRPHGEPVSSGFKYLGETSCAPSDGPWEHRVSITGPPGSSLHHLFWACTGVNLSLSGALFISIRAPLHQEFWPSGKRMLCN